MSGSAIVGLCPIELAQARRAEALEKATRSETAFLSQLWGIHLTGVARTLWQWNAPVSAPTTLSRLENFKLGSRLMQTAWTTWNGYDGLAASSARPVVIREDG